MRLINTPLVCELNKDLLTNLMILINIQLLVEVVINLKKIGANDR